MDGSLWFRLSIFKLINFLVKNKYYINRIYISTMKNNPEHPKIIGKYQRYNWMQSTQIIYLELIKIFLNHFHKWISL
jgi:hypothetical protein